MYGVPRRTLHRAASSLDVSGRIHLNRSGAQHALTEDEESFLVDCFVNFSDQDLPLTLELAKELVLGLWPSRRQHNGRRFCSG